MAFEEPGCRRRASWRHHEPFQAERPHARIKGKNTGPELLIGKALARKRLRFEKHPADLPGRPDIVFRRTKVAIFIDGDFWHGWRFRLWQKKLSPKWQDKIADNRARDQRNFRKLRRLGWTVIRIWEHQVEQDLPRCIEKIAAVVQWRFAIRTTGKSKIQ